MRLSFSFLPIPEEIMADQTLSWGAKYLFGIIAKINQEGIKLSNTYLAKRMGLKSIQEVRNRKNELLKKGLIYTNHRHGRVDEWFVNLILIQKLQNTPQNTPENTPKSTPPQTLGTKQSVEDTPQQSVEDTPQQSVGVYNKDSSIREGSNKELSQKKFFATGGPFDFSAFKQKMISGKNRNLQIIALYWNFKKYKFDNREQSQAALKRELRSAAALAGYPDKRIEDTMWELENQDRPFKWTLETVHKFIDEI